MTIGVDADYYLPSEREPKNLQKLSSEQLKMVDMVREQIAASNDIEHMHSTVGYLNDALRQDGLLGQSASLQSDFATVVSRGVDYETNELEVLQPLEIISAAEHEGVFVGCDVALLDGDTPELVYLLELPLITDDLRFRTVLAAVDDAKLTVEVDVSGIGQSLEALAQIKNSIVTRNLRLMGEIKDTDELDADSLSELSMLAIEILAQPEVAKNKLLKDAVAEIFASFVDKEEWYTFEGFDAEITEKVGSIKLAINQIEAVGQVYAVTTINDFEYIEAKDDQKASAVVSKTMQPAFIFKDQDTIHVVPTRYLTLFCVDDFSPTSSHCGNARERFLEEYPRLFKKPKGKERKISKHIINKCFQNEEGTV